MAWIFRGDRIKTAREIKDYTQSQVADKMGITIQQYSAWETGAVKPGQDSLIKLCNALECPPKFFYVDSDDDNHQTAPN